MHRGAGGARRMAWGVLGVCLGVLLASSSAWAQSGEWRDWASARYAWDTDREELEGERARNERLRAELGLPLLDLQPESAMLTPPGPGGRRESAGLEPLPVDRGPLTPRLEPVQPARGFDDEPPRSTSRVITTPDPVVVEEDPRLSREDERRRRADEERLRKEEERLRRDEEKARAQEEKTRRAQEDKLRRDEERRAAEEEEKRRAEEERLRRIEEARQETLRKKQEEEEKKKKAEAERKKKEEEEKRLQQLLKEKTNDRGQVVDDELKDLLDEAE